MRAIFLAIFLAAFASANSDISDDIIAGATQHAATTATNTTQAAPASANAPQTPPNAKEAAAPHATRINDFLDDAEDALKDAHPFIRVSSQVVLTTQRINILKEAAAAAVGEIDELENRKLELIDSSLKYFFIDKKMFDSPNLPQILAQSEVLKNGIKILKKGTPEYYTAAAKILDLRADEIYYGAIKAMPEAFANKDVIRLLGRASSSLSILGATELAEIEKSGVAPQITGSIIAKKTAYKELLEHFKTQHGIYEQNFLFSGISLKTAINKIEEFSPFTNPGFGKGVLIFLAMAVILSLRSGISKLIYIVFSYFYKGEDDETKKRFIKGIKNPLLFLLLIFGAQLGTSIFYYPGIQPLWMLHTFSVLYIATGAWLALGILNGYGMIVLAKLAQKSGQKEMINLIIKIVYFIVIIIAILLTLKKLGFNINTLIASLGIGGLAVALATKDIIANFFASIMLLFDNSFSQGDWINAGGVEGNVVEIGLRKTTIRTFENALVFVPNSVIMAQNITNFNRRKVGRRLVLSVGLTYGTSKESLMACVKDIKALLGSHRGVAQSSDSALNSNDFSARYRQNMVNVDDLVGYKNGIFVWVDEFADNSINIAIQCYTKSVSKAAFLATKEEIMLGIMDIVAKYEDADFAFPSRSIYIEKMPQMSGGGGVFEGAGSGAGGTTEGAGSKL